ncbi:unnamed protein product, partial [Cylicostephanus goldi]
EATSPVPLPDSASDAPGVDAVSANGNEQPKKKKKRNRKRKAESAVQLEDSVKVEEEQQPPRPKKKRKHLEAGKEELKIDDSRLRAYGINPKKFKNKLKCKFHLRPSDMGGVLSYFRSLFGQREMRILILGLDGAGKTTILYRLQVLRILHISG